MKFRVILAMIAAFWGLPAAATDVVSGDIIISGAHSFETAPNASTGAGYMVITNTGDHSDRLVDVHADFANAMIHLSTVDASGIARMQHQGDGVAIAAGETVEFARGGLHIMLMGLTAPLVADDRFTLTLTFEQAGSVDVGYVILGRGMTMDAHMQDGATGAGN